MLDVFQCRLNKKFILLLLKEWLLICEKCFSDEIESEEHLLLKCSFYYTSRRKLLETTKNNINHSNFEKLSFGDKFIWLLNSESKDTLICMCDFLLKSHCFG
jgi:hypothetical protein